MMASKVHSNRAVAKAKQSYWTDYVKGLDSSSRLSTVYGEIKKIKRQYVFPDPPIKVGDRVLGSSKEKAEAFAKSFAEVSSTNHLPETDRELRVTHERQHPLVAPPPDNSLPINCPISK
eukprot:TRINITY_DN76471_c0_g1_i6.p2 TRINITY_DN76471_c0_g1~~TRINITY_DN76471_c0_g1_i6.p2  ORF type:complete len:119 (+),score=16.65 TRINITY_DN76471_c0_g1_i6:901-1257(+)